jgi:hypothetical protein
LTDLGIIWEDNIKMGLKEIGCGDWELDSLIQDRDQWWVSVNTV